MNQVVASAIATARRHQPSFGLAHGLGEGQPAQGEGHQRSSTIASKRWFVPMLPALAARTSPMATQPTLGRDSGQTLASQASTPWQVRQERQREQRGRARPAARTVG